MKFTSAVLSGVVGAGAVASAMAFAGAAGAAPGDCTAAEFARTVSTVSSQTAAYLDKHADVNTGITNAAKGAAEGEKHEAVKTYLDGNQAAKADLEKIRQPLKDLKNRCGSTEPAQPAAFVTQTDGDDSDAPAQPAPANPFAPAADQTQAPADATAPASPAAPVSPATPGQPATAPAQSAAAEGPIESA